nr:hypothetical protein [Tanacetum cinerariifolium]
RVDRGFKTPIASFHTRSPPPLMGQRRAQVLSLLAREKGQLDFLSPQDNYREIQWEEQ